MSNREPDELDVVGLVFLAIFLGGILGIIVIGILG